MIKKILLALIALILLLFVVFFTVGLLNPSLSYQTTVEINKPLDVSWSYFNDEKNMKDWLPNFISIEKLSGNPNEIGSKFKMTFIENGEEMALIETMTDFKAKEIFAFTLENEFLTNNVKVKFSELNGKTILTQEENVKGAYIFWHSMFTMMKSYFSGATKTTLEKLKGNIENI
jgi:uncharacterized membrane protein